MAKNPQSDIAPVDDMAPVPVMPAPVDMPVIEQDQTADDIETQERAASYWHPAWAFVEKRFNDLLETYDGNNVMQFKDLPDAEFKIKVLAQQTVRAEVNQLMEDIKNAVETVEQQPNRPKQQVSSNPGT